MEDVDAAGFYHFCVESVSVEEVGWCGFADFVAEEFTKEAC